MPDSIVQAPKPKDWKEPSFDTVETLYVEMAKERQPVINRMWNMKRARRGDWKYLVNRIPAAYRAFVPEPSLPVMSDMIQRIVGLITREEPVYQVTPASSRPAAVSAAAKEESRLHALRMQIEDQQDRPTYAMGIDSQVWLGESWIGIFPDPTRLRQKDFERITGESGGEYSKRYETTMIRSGVPLCYIDFDPQTIVRRYAREQLARFISKTEHIVDEIEEGLGYKPLKNPDGSRAWYNKTLGEAQVPNGSDQAVNGAVSATVDRDTFDGSSTRGGAGTPEKILRYVYADRWTCLTFLDGVLVERWEHNYGYVPIVPALGEQTSDRDPAWESAGLTDAVLKVAEQLVLQAAILTANSMIHGFPTAFVKNPQHGITGPWGNEPRVRKVSLGQLNLLGQNEEIVFPYSQANMSGDFFKTFEWLQNQLENATPSNFGKALGTDIAGYAIAQIRNAQISALAPVYKNAARQWRKLGYITRHMVRTHFPGGLYLRGAVEEDDDGNQFQPVMRYAPEDCTDCAINVMIQEGIPQDEAARQKMAIELGQAGYWSPRRVMEETGVEDPEAEDQEIRESTLRRSPAYAQLMLVMAQAMLGERFKAELQGQNTPFAQALEQAKAKVLGFNPAGQIAGPGGAPNPAGGQPPTEGAIPGNQDAAGPIQQYPSPTTPLVGGPGAGPGASSGMSFSDVRVPQMPGGPKLTDSVAM